MGSVVALHVSIFNPTYITKGETKVLQSKMKRLLAYKLKVVTANVCDGTVNEYDQLIEDELVQIKFQDCGRSKIRLDDFFFKVVNIKLFKNLVKVVKLVLALSHGQASVERGLNINPLDASMKEESTVV